MGYGGAERLLVDMMAARDQDRFEYEFAYVLAAEDGLVPAIRANGVIVHPLGAESDLDLRWLPRFRRLLLEGDFDVVHFHLPYTAGLGRLVARSIPKSRRPALMYTEHSLWHKTPSPVRVLNRSTIGMDEALIVVSQAAFEDLPNELKAKAEVVVHGVDLSKSQELIAQRHEIRRDVRAELDISSDELLVITVANLRTEKGYDVLLDAARIVLDNESHVRFIAIGRGPQKEELELRHRRLGLGDRFTFLGPREDVLRLMIASDIFALPSHHEGLPVTLMEATSVGLAIVATDVGGVPGVVADGESALLVPPGNPAAFAAAIGRLCSNTSLRQQLGKSAAMLSGQFDVKRASEHLEKTYLQLTAEEG
jgi:glycosyltransferase involved in cell wall biosynthesis